VELALITAAQLPHLLPLDALTSGVAAAPAQRPPERPVQSAPFIPAPPASPQARSATPASPQALLLEEASHEPTRPSVNPKSAVIQVNPADPDSLRKACSEALASSASLRPFAAMPLMATALSWDPPTLALRFPANARTTVTDLERERANPHLLAALAHVLPGLAELTLAFEEIPAARPEDQLRMDPAFQSLLQATRGEIVDLRKE
jgi:DNA polymerase-3 subunit gamma/tau